MDVRIGLDGTVAAGVVHVRDDVPTVVRAGVESLRTRILAAVPHVVVDVIPAVAPAAVGARGDEDRACAYRTSGRHWARNRAGAGRAGVLGVSCATHPEDESERKQRVVCALGHGTLGLLSKGYGWPGDNRDLSIIVQATGRSRRSEASKKPECRDHSRPPGIAFNQSRCTR